MRHVHSTALEMFPDPLKLAKRTVAYSPTVLATGVDIRASCHAGDLSKADIEVISRPCADCEAWVNDCNLCGTLESDFWADDKQLADWYACKAARVHATAHSDGMI